MRKGIDIGGSFVKVVWENGKKEKFFIKDYIKDKKVFLETIKKIITDGNPDKVGIAVAGYTSLEGVVYRSPNIPILDGIDLKSFTESLGIRCLVMNDVSAGAYGLWHYYYRESRNLVFIAIGTGLGAGLVIDGKPYLGSCGSSLELGHHIIQIDGDICSCGRKGCWEAYCSSYGLERIYFRLSNQSIKDYQIIERALNDDRSALEAIEIFKRYLLTGILNTVHILNPDTLILGGGLVENLKGFLNELDKQVKSLVENLPASCLKIEYAPCGEFCMAMGALALSFRDDI